ncbi:MAG TPA: hypothetical protein VEN47_11770 [Myxococcota bacterium]|nr:hypothetical protein [Myxococcota bacterium]
MCAHHPERAAVEELGSRAYCAACRDALARATRALETRARPGECFARWLGQERWHALDSGAAAHWLAHELRIRPAAGRPTCAAGFAIERTDVLVGRRELGGDAPRAGDLWLDLDAEGCGIVETARREGERGIAIAIRRLRLLPARPETADFYLQLGGKGRFFR